MKLTTLAQAFALAPLVSAAAVARDEKVTYDGYKVFRVATHHDPEVVRESIADLNAVSLNMDDNEHLDVAVAPSDVNTFEDLGLETEVMHEDLGADIAVESDFAEYPGT